MERKIIIYSILAIAVIQFVCTAVVVYMGYVPNENVGTLYSHVMFFCTAYYLKVSDLKSKASFDSFLFFLLLYPLSLFWNFIKVEKGVKGVLLAVIFLSLLMVNWFSWFLVYSFMNWSE